MDLVNEKFVFYFGAESIFSHWYKCEFTINGKKYCSVEQYLMYKKALLFKDPEATKKILLSRDPKRHRYLGKQVPGFDKSAWQKECKIFCYEGDFSKFSQDNNLRKSLLSTGEKTLAEASPYDRLWGIGLSMQNPKISDRKNWRGKNWAGEVLGSVRSALK